MSRQHIWIISICLAAVAIADRLLKMAALNGATASWWIARFMLFKNDHVVFSWPLPNAVGTLLMLAAIGTVAWWGWRWQRQGKLVAATGAVMMLIGAVSNLYDRLRFGFVIDWAYLGRWWPVFNLADVMITVGVVCVLWPRKKG
jgi:lipoprotein signal peptidase